MALCIKIVESLESDKDSYDLTSSRELTCLRRKETKKVENVGPKCMFFILFYRITP